jgi:hypothetical protein
MWLVHLCCVIASFLVNMLFLNIKSGLFIIRLFFSNSGMRSIRPREAPDGASFARRCPSAAQGDDPGRGGHGVLLRRRRCAVQGGEVRGSGEENEAVRARRRMGDTALKARAECRAPHGRLGRPAAAAWTPGRGCLWLS